MIKKIVKFINKLKIKKNDFYSKNASKFGKLLGYLYIYIYDVLK
jgi:hypothetical protein